MSNRAFLDASFWIAYRDEREDFHPEAKRILSEVFRQRTRILTTFPVLCEIHAQFCRSPKKRRLVLEDFRDNPVVGIEEVTPQDQQDAFEVLRRQADKSYSLCDATSFVVMRRMGLKQVLSLDGHFRQFGEFEIIS